LASFLIRDREYDETTNRRLRDEASPHSHPAPPRPRFLHDGVREDYTRVSTHRAWIASVLDGEAGEGVTPGAVRIE
jgi:hypothetical protein